MARNGVAEFKKRLAKMPARVREAVNDAIEKDASEWVKFAKAAAPDDPETHGHDLRASIRHYRTDTGGQVVRAGGETTTRPNANGTAPFDYALAAEFGTQKHSGQPFFYPTYRLLEKKFQGRRRRALNKAIKETLK